jgi:hypothetical protein
MKTQEKRKSQQRKDGLKQKILHKLVKPEGPNDHLYSSDSAYDVACRYNRYSGAPHGEITF